MSETTTDRETREQRKRARIDQAIIALENRTDLHPSLHHDDPGWKDKCLCGHTRGVHWIRHHSLEGSLDCDTCDCEQFRN